MSEPITPEAISDQIDRYYDQGLEWLCEMIKYPSVQGQEQGVQAYVKGLLTDIGLEAQYHEIPDRLMEDEEYSHNENEQSYEGRYNVVGFRRGTGGGRSLILQSHTDVIPVPPEWPDGYTPRYDGEYVIGRGATDCKGCVVAIILACQALQDLNVELQGDLQVQLVIEEEPGGNGALALIRDGYTADAVIVSEASQLNVFPANRGAIWFQAKTTGIATHMGRRHEGVNAIEKMMEAIRWMLVYEEELIQASRGHPLFERYDNPVQVCLGMIRAGEWPSRVPDVCTLEGGVGFLPNKNMAEVKQELWDAVMRTEDPWLKEHFTLEFRKLHNDAYEIDPNHPIVATMHQAALDLGQPSEVFGWNVSCDARLYAKLAGLPTIVYGPSDIAEAHSTGEKIQYRELLAAAKGLALCAARWCNLAKGE